VFAARRVFRTLVPSFSRIPDSSSRADMASSSSNVVGVHYRVGKKIGEGSFGVIFEGTNLLNNQQVAIKFVRCPLNLTD
jgi:casein kinase 1